MFSFGICIGHILFGRHYNKTKTYSLNVISHWKSGCFHSIEADSVRGDTIWRDGDKFVSENIVSVNSAM